MAVYEYLAVDQRPQATNLAQSLMYPSSSFSVASVLIRGKYHLHQVISLCTGLSKSFLLQNLKKVLTALSAVAPFLSFHLRIVFAFRFIFFFSFSAAVREMSTLLRRI